MGLMIGHHLVPHLKTGARKRLLFYKLKLSIPIRFLAENQHAYWLEFS